MVTVVTVLGLLEVTAAATARRRAAERASVAAELDRLRARVRQADDAVAAAQQAAVAARRAADRPGPAHRVAPATPTPPPPPAADAPPRVARELVAVADRLADLAAHDPARAVRWLQERIDALLALCEVTVLAQGEGPLDLLRQEAVADRPAPDPALVDHVAETVRPGYLWRGELLRPQQVVAYVTPTPDPSTEETRA